MKMSQIFSTPFLMTVFCMSLLSLLKNKNPMKACSMMMITVGSLALTTWTKTAMSLGCYLIMTIFLGGMMILYMIMSSIIPNIKSVKSLKMSKIMASLFLMFMILIPMNLDLENKEYAQIKMTNKEFLSMALILKFMLAYSLALTKLSMKEETCLRMTTS